jgi:hypothetical protein
MNRTGRPSTAAYTVARRAGLNLYLGTAFALGGLALDIPCMWFIRVSVFRLAQRLFGPKDDLSPRTDAALKTMHVLLYFLTFSWILVSMGLGGLSAQAIVKRFP